MIGIGFDEEFKKDDLDLSADKVQKSNELVKIQREKLYIPERRLQEMRDSYDCVVVNDYNDDYHLSDEERKEKSKFYEEFAKLRKCKKKFRKLPEYIEVMRIALKCLDLVAEANGSYDPEVFKEKVLKGKIKVGGLFFPVYSGKDKKRISFDYLTEFVMSDQDPKTFYHDETEDLITDEEAYALKDTLFTKEELKRVSKIPTKKEESELSKFFDVDEDTQDDKPIAVECDDKQSKQILKAMPEIIYEFKNIAKKIDSQRKLDKYAYDLTEDDFDKIERYDEKHNIITSSTIPEFTGDISKDKDYNLYLMRLQEYFDNNIKENYAGNLMTIAEIREQQLRDDLEADGWNIRNLYHNKEKEKKIQKAYKRNKKQAEKLKEQLTKVQNRNKRILGQEVDTEKKSKKHSKKMKAKKNNLKEQQEDILLSTSGKQFESFEDWGEDVANFDWTNLN